MNQLSEEQILTQLKSPSQRSRAFDQLVLLHQQSVYFYVRRMVVDHDDANDIVQNVFIKAWKAIDGFREDSKISTWLYRIATNESLNFIQKQKRIAGIPLEDVEEQLPGRLENDVLYDGDEIQRRLDAAIAALPEKQKAVFILKYFDELKYEEIAQITDTSIGALKASYHHAVKKISESVVKG